MRASILHLAVAATLATAQPHHGHQRLHAKRDGSPVEKRDTATAVTYVPAYVTKYVLDNEDVTPDEAQAGLDKGLYVVVGESTPSFTPPPPPPPPEPTTSSQDGGIFLQQVETSSSAPPPPPPPPSSSAEPTSAPPPAPTSYAASPSGGSGRSDGGGSGGSLGGATGLDADFPDKEISCKTFPSKYGALATEWMGLGGWSGIQKVPNYKWGMASISYIETAVSGQSCESGQFCGYSCPAGYVQTQWPEAQGSTGQSVGGLYCNEDGVLELSRPSHKKLCEKGIGNIKIKNKMNQNVPVCRTLYPGTENMVVPLDATPGGTFDLANVKSSNYYVWNNKATTLQYYVNQPGVPVDVGCDWKCKENPDECGNWAPTIIGTGESDDGITYLSVFPNKPTSSANLKFNIKITGDVTEECELKGGQYSVSNDGCTVSFSRGFLIVAIRWLTRLNRPVSTQAVLP